MTLFEAAKGVGADDVAKRYGRLKMVTKGDKCFADCPFCGEHGRNMVFNLYGSHKGRYRCFKCGAMGSSVDFVAEMLDISPTEAAKRICADYSLDYEEKATKAKSTHILTEDEKAAYNYAVAVAKGLIAYCDDKLQSLPNDEYRELDERALEEMRRDAEAFLKAIRAPETSAELIGKGQEKLDILCRFLTREDRENGTNYVYWFNKGII